MYEDDPNVWEVVDLYNEYYAQHKFEKTVHMQNFKYWIRKVEPFVNRDGFIRKSMAPAKEFRGKLLSKPKTKNGKRQACNTAAWQGC